MADQQPSVRISAPREAFEEEVIQKLRAHLDACADLAFAYLAEVEVPETGEMPGLVLFVWLRAAAMRSMRSALNLVSDAVAKALPGDRFLDVVILNSAPELLSDLERANCLFLEAAPEERSLALSASMEELDNPLL